MATKTDRFRPVDVRMPADPKFRALSAPQPNAQTLFERLLTSGDDRSIPGLYAAGIGTYADRLNWSYDATARCWLEIEAQDLAELDRSAGVIWTPRAIHNRPPTSPQQVKGWGRYWKEIPACALKLKAWHAILAWFDNAITEAHAKEKDRARKRRRKTGDTNNEGSTHRSSHPKTKSSVSMFETWRALFVETCPEPVIPTPLFPAAPLRERDEDSTAAEPQPIRDKDVSRCDAGVGSHVDSPLHAEVAYQRERIREHDLPPPPACAREGDDGDALADALWVLDEWNRRERLPPADRNRDTRVEPALIEWCRRGYTRRQTRALFNAMEASDWARGEAPSGPSEPWPISRVLGFSDDQVLRYSAGHLEERPPSNPDRPADAAPPRRRNTVADNAARRATELKMRRLAGAGAARPARPDHGADGPSKVIDLNSSEWTDTDKEATGESN